MIARAPHRRRPRLSRWLARVAIAILLAYAVPAAALEVAFYYGAQPPFDELRAFDVAVVEPDHVPDPARYQSGGRGELFAYVSVCEQAPSRTYFEGIERVWRLGENPDWGSVIIDQAQPAWREFFVDRIIGPLYQRGYRGFFLDTLDSYHLVARTPQARARQEAGLVDLIGRIKAKYPDVRLILNRGFEILPQVHAQVAAVAAESLYQRWDQANQAYGEVPPDDRGWLLAQLERVRAEYRLPVIAIDYVPPRDRALARETAARIRAHGFIPYVADPRFLSLGVGNIEVFPRKIAFVHAMREGVALDDQIGHRLAAMPLNYLGYTVEYFEVGGPLPQGPLTGRYAGIVSWLGGSEAHGTAFPDWLKEQLAAGVRFAAFEGFGFEPDDALMEQLGIERVGGDGSLRVSIRHRDPIVGFEHDPLMLAGAIGGYRVKEHPAAAPLLRFGTDSGFRVDNAAITPAGGFMFAPNAVIEIPIPRHSRWVIQPIEFLRRALATPDMPVPDVTTENGRRLMLVHIDGDGFPSRAELPGSPLAGQVLLREVLQKYRVPTTMSVIQGEVSPRGLFKDLAPSMEAIAREMFALSHVEIASHSLSHPFNWVSMVNNPTGAKPGTMNLALPGYTFNLHDEIPGSLEYINKTLAPPGKRGELMLWTGDCYPPEVALKLAYEHGFLNMNGGDTVITRSVNSWTLIAPLGVKKGAYYQVYAPNQNENVYTNDWTGPYYGFERVIETFELTDSPYRFKPINIYYHTYSATKRAALRALNKVYDYALSQPVMNVYTSEYVRKVLDFNRMVVARDWGTDAWRIHAKGDLRTVRIAPQGPTPDLLHSRGVAGFAPGPNARYVHLTGADASLKLGGQPADSHSAGPIPALHEANGRLVRWDRAGGTIEASFDAHVPLTLEFANVRRCELYRDGRVVTPGRVDGDRKRYAFDQAGRQDIRLVCA